MKGRALRRSLSDFKRHPWLHFISISTITVALLIQGGFLLCYRNFESIAEQTNPQVTGTVYLMEGMVEPQLGALKEKILSQPNVKNVTYKNRDSVVKDLQVLLGNSGRETMPGSEMFPDVLELELSGDAEGHHVTELKQVVSRMPGVAEVDFSEDWLMQFKRVRQFLTIFGIVLMVAMVVGCSFIIANFMGMRHQSRKSEIDIVRLIGGHNSFILVPFLWESLIEGMIGTVLSLGILYFLQLAVMAVARIHWVPIVGVQSMQYLSLAQVFLVLVIGLSMAFMGSVTVFLRFKESSPR